MTRRSFFILPAIVVAVIAVTTAPAFAQRSPIGTNLTRIDDWSPDFAFLDVFKTSRPWFSGTNSIWQDSRPLDLDARGWVRSLQPGQIAKTLMFWDLSQSPGQYPAGRYVVTYEGSGTIEYRGGAVRVETRPGRDVIDVLPSRGGGIGLFITATDPSNYIRNLHVRMPSAAPDTELFNPVFLDRISRYRRIRFMDWQATNGDWTRTGGSQQRRWSDRPLVDDAQWSGTHGVPIEVMAALANRLGADAWFSMPHQADDDYVRQFAQAALQLLSPNLRVYVEYSNEVWNGGYAQAWYAQQQGLALGLSANAYEAQIRFHSRRSREIFGIWETVFPQNRLVRVLGSFHANPFTTTTALSYGDTAAHTDAVATAPYFGVWDMAAARNMSLDTLMRALELTALPEALAMTRAQVDAARRFNVPVIAYEAGQSLVGVGQYQGDPTLNALFDTANRDPRMGTLYTRYLQDWSTATGGQLLMHFIDCSAFGQYGRFGSLEYLDQPRSAAPKFDALMRWIEQDPGPWSAPIAPYLAASVTGTTVTLTWTPSVVATSYDLEAGSRTGASDLVTMNLAASSLTTTAGPGTYYVRLRARNGAGVSAPSNEIVVRVGGGPCAALIAPSPLSATVVGSAVTLTWAGVAGAASYVLEAGSSPGSSNLLVNDTGSPATALAVTGVQRGTYYVRVRASNGCGPGPVSNEVTVVVP